MQGVEVGVRLGHLSGDLVVAVELGLDLADALLDVAEDGLVSLSGGSCMRMPTCSPASGAPHRWRAGRVPAMILRIVDLPAPLGPTTPILAPGRTTW
jgi:hypothetical protein